MNRITRMPRRTLPALLVAAAVTLGACSQSADHGAHTTNSPAASAAPGANDAAGAGAHSEADIDFAEQMIEHHKGAVEMADLAADRAQSADVKALAAKIKAAQQPEIDLMSSWLEAWGGHEHGSGEQGSGGHGAHMPGMMSAEQMAALQNARGTEFDRMFLELMVEHHEGAITMSKDQIAGGQSPEAVSLAKKIIADQTAEIGEMKRMLAAA